MKTLSLRILEYAATFPEGTPLSARKLLNLGSRAAVDQALFRLAQQGQLERVGRGLYVRPVETRFGKRLPSVEKVVQGIASAKGETVASHGAAAANALGLTTQVPVRTLYLTSGQSRQFNLGEQTIELRHAPRWQLVLAGHPAGEAVRALAWLGESRAGEVLPELQRRLPAQAFQEIASVSSCLPTWLAKEVSQLVANG
ncbi:MAG TPA: DUF6088 family protein [Terracidiphilus sp.]|nr:DUF6088 family protein [Terracidiphilus sp.]